MDWQRNGSLEIPWRDLHFLNCAIKPQAHLNLLVTPHDCFNLFSVEMTLHGERGEPSYLACLSPYLARSEVPIVDQNLKESLELGNPLSAINRQLTNALLEFAKLSIVWTDEQQVIFFCDDTLGAVGYFGKHIAPAGLVSDYFQHDPTNVALALMSKEMEVYARSR
jgi:hypothetical protein